MEIDFKTFTNPKEMHSLSDQALEKIAAQIRQLLLDSVAKTGGHLSSNLGVVELTVALMAEFDFGLETDQIVWDVGHQSYAYKMLTNRWQDFPTLRQYQGLSGFPKREESLYDFFDTGHSSTSLSGALGLLRGKKLQNKAGKVLAVIGDGALTCGMAYEALNDAGHGNDNLIVILNDNQMSIDGNVGAVSRHLSSLRASYNYIKIKQKAEKLLKKIPLLGKLIFKGLGLCKDILRLIIRRKHPVIFEDMGFAYYGPVDGHDIGALRYFMRAIKEINGPVLLHVSTKKGKGYVQAEDNPRLYHGVAPFDVEIGCDDSVTSTSFTHVFANTLTDLAGQNPEIVAVCAAMMSGTGLDGFAKKYPERFFDVGIAEEHAVTMAAGMAVSGLTPIVALYSTFLQRGFDQIIHDVCLQKLHVVFAIDRAGIVGPDGETHQGLYDMAILLALPDIEIFAPSSYKKLQETLEYSIFHAAGPVAIRYPKGGEGKQIPHKKISTSKLTKDQLVSQVKKAQWIQQSSDAKVCFITVGAMLNEAVIAVNNLEERGIVCTILDLNAVKPLDFEGIREAANGANYIFTLEDGIYHAGVYSQILQFFHSQSINTPLYPVGIEDNPVPTGQRQELLEREKMDGLSIARYVLKIVE